MFLHYQDHLAPGHAQVCCSKVSTEEAIIEAAREVRVRADHGLGPQSSPQHRAEEPADSLKCKLRTIIITKGSLQKKIKKIVTNVTIGGGEFFLEL